MFLEQICQDTCFTAIQTVLTVPVAGRIRQGVCRDSGRGCRGRRGLSSHFSSAQADSSGFHFPEHRHGNA